jgi:hypothetical protein
MRDPELVARAQRAAARLESAWEQWRALHGLAVTPAQPVVSYVGYSLNEPWGEPRVVIGIDADEAEFLAEFLDRDECGRQGQQSQEAEYTSPALLGAPVPLGIPRQTGDASRELASRELASREMAAELAGWSSGELPGQASEHLAGWPKGMTQPGLTPPGLTKPGLTSPGLAAAAEQPPGAA